MSEGQRADIGEAYSCQISKLEVIDGKGHKRISKGNKNVKRTCSDLKGHSNHSKQGGPRPTAKVPHGQEDHCEVKWDVWLCDSVDTTHSQVNHDSVQISLQKCTITSILDSDTSSYEVNFREINHLKDIPSVFTTSSEDVEMSNSRLDTDNTDQYKCVSDIEKQNRAQKPSAMQFGIQTAVRDKCTFYKNEVVDTSTTDAILEMPVPNVEHQLRRHMSYVRAPLDSLSETDVKFEEWKAQHRIPFQKCKNLAGNSALLAHF